MTAQTIRFLGDRALVQEIIRRYATEPSRESLGYATVCDYCDSFDHLPQIAGADGDLKNVQRPWAIKTLLRCLPPPARLLEIGGGEPIVSGFLAELGYDVTLIDPYDGTGNGPTEFETYRARFPAVKLIRGVFGQEGNEFGSPFDGIFSVSVLEHIPPEPLRACLRAIPHFLVTGGFSIHCFDFIVAGAGEEYARQTAEIILTEQAAIAGEPVELTLADLVRKLEADIETFFLSPQGHNNWRAGVPYDQFAFRRVASVQTIVQRRASS